MAKGLDEKGAGEDRNILDAKLKEIRELIEEKEKSEQAKDPYNKNFTYTGSKDTRRLLKAIKENHYNGIIASIQDIQKFAQSTDRQNNSAYKALEIIHFTHIEDLTALLPALKAKAKEADLEQKLQKLLHMRADLVLAKVNENPEVSKILDEFIKIIPDDLDRIEAEKITENLVEKLTGLKKEIEGNARPPEDKTLTDQIAAFNIVANELQESELVNVNDPSMAERLKPPVAPAQQPVGPGAAGEDKAKDDAAAAAAAKAAQNRAEDEAKAAAAAAAAAANKVPPPPPPPHVPVPPVRASYAPQRKDVPPNPAQQGGGADNAAVPVDDIKVEEVDPGAGAGAGAGAGKDGVEAKEVDEGAKLVLNATPMRTPAATPPKGARDIEGHIPRQTYENFKGSKDWATVQAHADDIRFVTNQAAGINNDPQHGKIVISISATTSPDEATQVAKNIVQHAQLTAPIYHITAETEEGARALAQTCAKNGIRLTSIIVKGVTYSGDDKKFIGPTPPSPLAQDHKNVAENLEQPPQVSGSGGGKLLTPAYTSRSSFEDKEEEERLLRDTGPKEPTPPTEPDGPAHKPEND